MRKTILLTIMLMLGVFGMRAEYNWDTPPVTAYSHHLVVYATVRNTSGEQVGDLGDNTIIGAFIDGSCRGAGYMQTVSVSDTETNYLYTFRLGVSSDDAGKEVKFVIKGATEIEITETLKTNGGDETVGMPSSPFSLTFSPVTEIAMKEQQLTVRVGEEITKYLKHTYTLVPEDATVKESGISYSVPTASNILRANDDGTITAISSGSESMEIIHTDAKSVYGKIEVRVVDDIPTADDFKIINNPLTVQLAEYEVNKMDILDKIVANVSASGSAPSFPNSYSWAEGPNVAKKILTFYNNTSSGAINEVIANEYGNTRIEWTYSVKSAGFDENGAFVADKEYKFTAGFDLNIVQAVSSIDAVGFVMGLDDENATIRIETVPANYLLDEKLLKWDIPNFYDDKESPILEIGERIEGKNEWKVKPLALNKDKNITVDYNNILSDTAWVRVLQRINLNEGWHWISLYADEITSKDQIASLMGNAQEIRSQRELLYNDPVYGFFGELEKMYTSDSYKIYVKEGKSVNAIIPDISLYSGNAFSISASSGWNWLGSPYCFCHNINDALPTDLEDDTRIVSKDGFAVLTDGKWVGTLETFVAGEGYLFYNPVSYPQRLNFSSEQSLKKVERPQSSQTRAQAHPSSVQPWNYDDSRFANNMTIIAKGTEDLDANRYSIGAFVGDECRGKGLIIDGNIFITVHGEKGEKVNFKLHDSFSNTFSELPNQIEFTDMCGTIKNPIILNTTSPSGIEDIIATDDVDLDASEFYTVSGQRVKAENLTPGIYIVRSKTASGYVTHKFIKK